MKLIFVILTSLILTSCFDLPKLEEGDTIKKCVIDTMIITESPSTLEHGKVYHYITDCGYRISTRRNTIYNVGDTITYIYKKR